MSDTIEKLRNVSVATLATAMYKRGLRNQVIQDVRPLSAKGRNMVEPACTLRYMPAHEDRNTLAECRNPEHPQRHAIETCSNINQIFIRPQDFNLSWQQLVYVLHRAVHHQWTRNRKVAFCGLGVS